MNYSDILKIQNVLYCFDFINTSCAKKTRSVVSLTTMYVFMFGSIILTVGGNMVVIISISHFKKLHSPTNLLIVSLAATDFLLGLVVMPFSMVRTIESCWYFGDLFCTIHTCCDIMLCTASIFHLCFISIDRYYAVCQPLHYMSKITPSVAEGFVFISWSIPGVFAFGLVLSEIHLDGIQDYVTSITCTGFCSLIFNQIWGVMCSLITFFIPGTVMVGIYVHIFTVANKQAKQIDTQKTMSMHESKGCNKVPQKKEHKAAQTLSIVMGVFILCWLPFFILTIADPFLGFSTPEDLYNAALWLGYFNSTFNPIIYGLFYPWFRKAFINIITGKIFSKGSSSLNLFPSDI
ncbi:trace amine-associated receptor 4-like [Ambystoma mexicanum]|uniref:trace amine-associated receptor 4-like n=1 Tax=Ambystoma mexicanum TaxID=8296 RepID=UPI0037E93A99